MNMTAMTIQVFMIPFTNKSIILAGKLRSMKRFLYSLLIGGMILTACQSDEATSKPVSDATSQPENSGASSQPEKPVEIVRDNMPEDAAQKLKEVSATKNNTISPYRYLISSDDFSTFAQLLKASTLTKHIHGTGVTVLAPTNNAMSAYDGWKKWIANNDTEKIDDFVASYVLNDIYSRKEIETETMVLNHAGNTLQVEGDDGACFVEGSPVSSEFIETKNGMVLQLDQLYYRP